MKAILEFNLPEDIDAWNMQKNTVLYYMAVEDVRCEIRRLLKYDESLSDDTDLVLRNLLLILPDEDIL